MLVCCRINSIKLRLGGSRNFVKQCGNYDWFDLSYGRNQHTYCKEIFLQLKKIVIKKTHEIIEYEFRGQDKNNYDRENGWRRWYLE